MSFILFIVATLISLIFYSKFNIAPPMIDGNTQYLIIAILAAAEAIRLDRN